MVNIHKQSTPTTIVIWGDYRDYHNLSIFLPLAFQPLLILEFGHGVSLSNHYYEELYQFLLTYACICLHILRI
jgi:hypothetical protein